MFMGIKYRVNESFFEKWSPRMAYVLGYIYADGSLEDASYLRGRYLRVTSTDKIAIKKIRSWLESKHTIIHLPPRPHHKQRYMLRIGSHKIYTSLTKHGLYPNKSLTIGVPTIPRQHINAFVRGYFDGDGCVFFEKARGKKKMLIVKRLSIIFTSGSRDFLEELGIILQQTLGLKNKAVHVSQRAFQLRYSTRDTLKLFKFLYKKILPDDVVLKRKADIFFQYFIRRPSKIDNNTKSILKCLGGSMAKW